MEKQISFNRSLITLVIPIALQNLIIATVGIADVVMLGMISQSAMSAVSLAGQITFVMTLFFFGISAGASILAAQYWGKNKLCTIQRVLSIACIFSLLTAFVFFVSSACFPNSLMRIFTKDVELIVYGAKYQQIVSFSYLIMSLSQVYLSVARSIEKVRFSAIVSSMCLILNIALNAVVIFVLYPGQSEKAIMGVATSTVIVRCVEFICCVIFSKRKGYIKFKLPKRDNIQKQLVQDYLRYTLPIQGNYIVWGVATAATAAIIGHVDSDMVAANSIVSVVRNLAIVLCSGIATGGSILIGKYLGSGDIQFAKKAGKKLSVYALMFGVIAGISILLINPFISDIVDLNDKAQGYLNKMLYICAYYCIGKSLNTTFIAGIFPAGGDSKFGFICDTVVMWGIVLPLSFLCAFVWRADPMFLYMVICLDEFIKLPAAFWRFCQYRWLNNITRNFSKTEKLFLEGK